MKKPLYCVLRDPKLHSSFFEAVKLSSKLTNLRVTTRRTFHPILVARLPMNYSGVFLPEISSNSPQMSFKKVRLPLLHYLCCFYLPKHILADSRAPCRHPLAAFELLACFNAPAGTCRSRTSSTCHFGARTDILLAEFHAPPPASWAY